MADEIRLIDRRLLSISLSAFSAKLLVSEETGRLLAELVRVFQEYDIYNARCRGNTTSTKTENCKLSHRKSRLSSDKAETTRKADRSAPDTPSSELLFARRPVFRQSIFWKMAVWIYRTIFRQNWIW